ncbi:S1C family serine protease [Nocardiopsis halophila]|uniref:S1C family serine protease n=1 Tax=Nocardiopsis halophila TaxID=141692 RepID=UPI0003472D9C|nr:trypsin-like peptidase domain-containing protein [Nocardiopsis halophila]
MSAEDRREAPGDEPRTDRTPENAPEAPAVDPTADTVAEEPRAARDDHETPPEAAQQAPQDTPPGAPGPAGAGPWTPPGGATWTMRSQGGHAPGTAGAAGAPPLGAHSGPQPSVQTGQHTSWQYAASHPSGPHAAGHGPAAGHPGGGGGVPPTWPGAVPPPGGQDGGGSGGRRKRPGPVAIAAATALVTSLIVGPAAAVATTFLTGGTSSPVSSLTGGTAGSVSTGSVSEVAEKVLPSVVSIQTGSGSGSGVVIGSDGKILTNAHVVAGASGDSVQVRFNDGTDARAKVLGVDTVSDIAVIEAQGVSGLTPATFGDSDKVEVGADVVAIGSPLGLSGTVTSGVVSAVERPVNTGAADGGQEEQDPFGLGTPEQGQVQTSTVINAIQTDAPINPGNSGGPLINMNGEVIGVNTAIAGTSSGGQGEPGSIGLGFAIPINQAKPIAEQLIDQGSADYAAIGATVAADRDGVRIVDTSKGGAAAEAGLESGDVVTSVDGEAVDGPDGLIAKIRSKQPGETVTMGYTRDGKEDEVQVTLDAQSADSIGG